MPPVEINISTFCGANRITDVSNRQIDVKAPAGTQITINWNAAGTTFPTSVSDAISWKPGFEGTGTFSRPTNAQIRLVYSHPGTKVTWKYNIKLETCARFDPDINNNVPGGPPAGQVVGGGGSGQPGGGQPGGGQPGGGQPGGRGGQPGNP